MSSLRAVHPLVWAGGALSLGLVLGGIFARPDAKSEAAAFSAEALGTLSSGKTVSLAGCPTAKCLTVVVAPWCGYCRAATPHVLALRDYLDSRGVTTRVVVGMDKTASVKAYALEFGPDTLLDPEGQVSANGVPHFFVTDAAGAVLKEVAGVPAGLDGLGPKDFASFLGLP